MNLSKSSISSISPETIKPTKAPNPSKWPNQNHQICMFYSISLYSIFFHPMFVFEKMLRNTQYIFIFNQYRFAQIVFSPNVFLPNIFSPNTFCPISFNRKCFLLDRFLLNLFSPNVFLPNHKPYLKMDTQCMNSLLGQDSSPKSEKYKDPSPRGREANLLSGR